MLVLGLGDHECPLMGGIAQIFVAIAGTHSSLIQTLHNVAASKDEKVYEGKNELADIAKTKRVSKIL